MQKLLREELSDIRQLAPSIYKLTIKSDFVSCNAVPGQFVNIKCQEGLNALLRRPISICNVDRNAKTFDVVFQVKGTGTEFLSRIKSGEKIDLIGPSGNGFNISKEHKSIMVVGGGIGTFPLLFLLNESPAIDKKAFLGFREKQAVVLQEDFEKAAGKVFFSTDDGSFGSKGLVTVPLCEEIAAKKPDIIYTCGPMPMIKKVVEIAKENDIKCQVSLEQRMGCGIGACLVCACKTKFGDDWEYSHICSDGPVFDSDKVVFE